MIKNDGLLRTQMSDAPDGTESLSATTENVSVADKGKGDTEKGNIREDDAPATEESDEAPQTGKQTKKALFYEILRFLIVGGLATVADYAMYYLFRQWLLPPTLIESGTWDTFSLVIATALGFCVGLIVNWILSVKFVFRDVKDKKQSRSKKSFIVFTIIGVIGLAITEIGMHLGVRFLRDFSLFGTPDFLGLVWKEWLMKVIMTAVVLVWNYVGRKLFVFKS